ncbi:hypothetical protein M422DRAFT_785347, partial [Sphaerobolus stellatus SS14]
MSSIPDDRLEGDLKRLLSSDSLKLPISTPAILGRLVANGTPLRLTDRQRLETLLLKLAHTSKPALLSVRNDADGVYITAIHSSHSTANGTHKRKHSDLDEPITPVRDAPLQSTNGTATALLPSADTVTQEIFAMLQRGTARSKLLAEQFASKEDNFEAICEHITKEACAKSRAEVGVGHTGSICDRIHFRPLIRAHTDPSLGHCSYLNTCYSEPTYALSPSIPPFPSSQNRSHNAVSLPSGLGAGGRGKEKAPCRYLHFEVDYDGTIPEAERERKREKTKRESNRGDRGSHKLGIGSGPMGSLAPPLPPQWINCDLRSFDYSVLGKFHVIMADPPWDIHMSLPYGTMTDDEMRAMPIPTLQDEGLLFLWVTGRAMEVGRECMRVWGYTRVDEVIWLKTNQLQRVIRTGRTGHWLNHTKEHMLVGVKTVSDENGNLTFPSWVNRGLDTDVIVSEVRETSRKPEEVYGLIERMCPGGRKVEIFGRKHNVRPGWLTLGNQLGNADQIYEEDLAERVAARYPERANLALQENEH